MDVTPPARYVSISLPLEETSGVGEARRVAIKLAESLQFSEPDVGRVALVVTEAASNIVQHARRGEILLRAVALEAPVGLEVLALDQGPGIANVAQSLRDGFSTGGSAGLGLGAIARLSTEFEISSTPGKGTALLSRIGRGVTDRPQPDPSPRIGPGSSRGASRLEWGVVCVPKRGEEVCGDAWAVVRGHDRNTVLIVDGLGHGLFAFDAAQQALRAFWGLAGIGPASRLSAVHEAMCANRTTLATRGAVAAMAEIDWQKRKLRYCGAGNISGTLVPVAGVGSNLVSLSGTLGENVTRFEEFVYPWPEAGLLVLHSDGLSNHWELEPYPGLSRKHPSLIAGVLYRDFANRRDDVVVVVGRERSQEPAEQDGKSP
jgi:anti-sigma regulatory factor (Ser/Thr protein kinase)